jgi:rhodanese-related sulfurtransferase
MKIPHLLIASLVVSSTLAIAQDQSATSTAAKAPATSAAAQVKNVTPAEAEALMKEKKDVVVLDVRTPEEFQSGHIAGAKNVDFQDDKFAEQLAGLDKNAPYVLHCAAGGRSTRALKKMNELGFKTIYHMNGGFNAWKEAGKPVAK